MDSTDYNFNNDPNLICEVHQLRSDVNSLHREVGALKEMNEFLRQIINTLISK